MPIYDISTLCHRHAPWANTACGQTQTDRNYPVEEDATVTAGHAMRTSDMHNATRAHLARAKVSASFTLRGTWQWAAAASG